MRLINTSTLCLEEFHDARIPDYAILSHTWGSEEVTFQQWITGKRMKTSGFSKVEAASELAKRDGYAYIWVDTACIDKTSSAELTEAINSMFAWYARSQVCYAYIADVPTFKPLSYRASFCRSRWFTRGWTLQELLAPRRVVFYAADWSCIGTKATLARSIATATGIDVKHFFQSQSEEEETSAHHQLVYETAISEKMSWLARRETTRIEDMAYCMLGLFGIYMPLLYGEGTRAFIRLQEELFKVSDDHTIFCWSWATGNQNGSMVLPRPHGFLDAACYLPQRAGQRPLPYSLTNAGLSIKMPLIECWASWIGVLSAAIQTEKGSIQVGLPMLGDLSNRRFVRQSYPDCPIPLCDITKLKNNKIEDVFVPAGIATKWGRSPAHDGLRQQSDCQAGLILSFSPREEFVDIVTFPPDRFSRNNSILELCPTQSPADNSRLSGLTVVEFTLKNGRKELIAFAILYNAIGCYFQTEWFHFHLPDSFQSHKVRKTWHQFGPKMDDEGWTSITDLVSKLIIGEKDDDSGDGSNLSVAMAPMAFSTNDACILKHVHINFQPSTKIN